MLEKINDLKLAPCESYGKVTCEPRWKWDTTNNPLPDYDFWYVWDGEGEVQLNGTPYPAARGTCFLFQPGDRTSAWHNPQKPLVVTYIHFRMEACREELPASFQEMGDKLVFEMLLDRYIQANLEKQKAFEQESILLLKCLLFQWLRCGLARVEHPIGEKKGRLYTVLNEVANFIRQHPGERHSIADLASRAGLSQRYFSMKFKEAMGMTVEQFIIRSKMNRAEHLLRFNGMSVSQVAEVLGYANIHFFSRQFKQFRGISPSQLTKNS